MSKLIYLASPYSHTSTAIRASRFEAAQHICEQLLLHHNVFPISPIAHWAGIVDKSNTDVNSKLVRTFTFWRKYDYALIDACEGGIYIATLPGWTDSVGVNAERAYAREHNYPTTYVELLRSGRLKLSKQPFRPVTKKAEKRAAE